MSTITPVKSASLTVNRLRRWHGQDHPSVQEAESVLAERRIERAIAENRDRLSPPTRAALAADLMRAE